MDVFLRKKLLWRMLRHRWIGGKHTDIRNLRKGFTRSRYGEVDAEIRRLATERLLSLKPTFYGLHVSLDPARLGEVKNELGL